MTQQHRTALARPWTALAVAALAAATLAGCTTPGTDVEPTPSASVDATDPAATATTEPTESTDVDPSTTETPTPDATADDGRRDVHVTIIGVEWLAAEQGLEVRSFVSDYIGDGTCTYTATAADGTEASIEVDALPDAQTTVCPTRVIPGITDGTWSVVVSFDNDEAHGESEAHEVEAGA